MNINSVEVLQSRYPGRTIEQYRTELGRFGITGDTALQSVLSLSGGQKCRVAFSLMCMKKYEYNLSSDINILFPIV